MFALCKGASYRQPLPSFAIGNGRAQSSPNARGAQAHNERQTTAPPQPASLRRPPPAPSVLLPLPTVLGKLQNDPQRLLGWEVRLLPIINGDGGADNAVKGRRQRGRPRTLLADDVYLESSNAVGGWGRSLGQVVEVLLMAGEASPSTAVNTSISVFSCSKSASLDGRSGNGVAAGNAAASASAVSHQRTCKPVSTFGGNIAHDEGGGGACLRTHQQVMLRAVHHTVIKEYDFAGNEEYVIHLDPEALPYADMNSQTLLVVSGTGLLEQGRKSLLLQLLSRELRNLAQRPRQAAVVAATELPTATATDVAPRRPVLERAPAPPMVLMQSAARMPTRQQLLDAGRGDLLDLISAAGGSNEVALHLGLRCTRRPRGYWRGPDSWERLAEELAAFVASGWAELPHPDYPGRTYFYNQVSHRATWRRPPPLQRLPAARRSPMGRTHGSRAQRPEQGNAGDVVGVRWLVAEAAADRVMPSRSLVQQAQRLDLHNAIEYHGGYLHVAAQLGRRVTWAPSKHLYDNPAEVRRQLTVVAKELQLPPGVLPTSRELRQSGYGTLLNAVRRHEQLRNLLGIRTRQGSSRRRPRRRWDDLGALAAELARFAAMADESPPLPLAPEAMENTAHGDGGGDGDSSSSSLRINTKEGSGQRPYLMKPAAIRGGTKADNEASEQVGEASAVDGGSDWERVAIAASSAEVAVATSSGGLAAAAGAPTSAAAAVASAGVDAAAIAMANQGWHGRPNKQKQQQQEGQQGFVRTAGPDTTTIASVAVAAEPPPSPLQPPPPRMPRLSQLRAAGRHDLVYTLSVRHAGVSIRQLAEQLGLKPVADRRGCNRNALRLEVVVKAIQAGCQTPKAIREHLGLQQRIDISRQHLTSYLTRMATEGKLVKLSYGRYGLRRPAADSEG